MTLKANTKPESTSISTSYATALENPPRDFPGGPVVKNLPSNAGDAGLIPGWGTKIPRATGQLSPCDTTREPTCCNY